VGAALPRVGRAMSDTGCPHPEGLTLDLGHSVPASPAWCRMCGSIRVHGEWTAPMSLVLPGWSCEKCGSFNGAAKELRTDCRSCGAAFDPERTT